MGWKVGDAVYVPAWTPDSRPGWAVSAMDCLSGHVYTVREVDDMEEGGGVRFHEVDWWWKSDYLVPPFDDTEVDPATGIELAEFLGI